MKIKEGFSLRTICGQSVVTADGLAAIDYSKLITLNESAAYLWKNIEGKEFTSTDLADLLMQEYGIEEAVAAPDAEAICASWKDLGLLED